MAGGEHIGTHSPIWHIGKYTLHGDTIIVTWIVTGILLLLAFLATRNLKKVPTGLQNVMEMAIEFIDGIIESNMGIKGRSYFPLIGTLFFFILFSNLLGIIPIPWFGHEGTMLVHKSPTADVNTTFALAIVVVLVMHISGVVKKGLFHYLKHFIKPNILFLPLNIIEELARPVTLAFRLFGNIVSGEILGAVLIVIVPLFVPIFSSGLDLFIAGVQAYVFTILSTVYIAGAVAEEELH